MARAALLALAVGAARGSADSGAAPEWWQGIKGGEDTATPAPVAGTEAPLWWQAGQETSMAASTSQQVVDDADDGWAMPTTTPPPVTAAPLAPGDARLNVACVLGLVQPCGEVVVPGEGVYVQTPLGKVHVVGSTSCGQAEDVDAMHCLYLLLLITGLSVFCLVAMPGQRRDLSRLCELLVQSKASTDPEHGEEGEELSAAHHALDVGGIYQALAVLHPGIIGYHRWSRCCARGIACLLVQLYLAGEILARLLGAWEFWHLKSPVWLLAHFWDGLAALVGLGMLCRLFALRCSEGLITSLEASTFILARRHVSLISERSFVKEDDLKGLLLVIFEPCIEFAVAANAFLWCFASLAVSLLLAVLLQASLLLRIATFRDGDIEQLILTAVGLYFVLDADRRLLAADPRLHRSYQRHICSLELHDKDDFRLDVREAPTRPSYLVKVGAILAIVLLLLQPASLLLAAGSAWRERTSGWVMGGSPVCNP